MIKNFREAEEYMFQLPMISKKNTVEDNISFYQQTGKPADTCNVIHVAGTNGKGSVCSYIDGIVRETGFSVGMFTSPHLVTIRERIQINRVLISEDEFLDSFQDVMGKVTKDYLPSFFELLFFMAMSFFEKKEVDYVILETGLGGRLDITNIIETPCMTIITKIGIDHTKYLGNTIEEIAKEKAGIIKKRVPLIFLDDKEKTTSLLVEEAKKKDVLYCAISPPELKKIRIVNKSIDFSIKSRYHGDISISLSTRGIYQVENVALAIAAIEVLFQSEGITTEALQKGIENTRWQGRMEEILPNVYLDGAHNIDGIYSFMKAVEAFSETNKKNNLLFSAVKDKDYKKMIKLLAKGNLFDSITVTEIDGAYAVDCLDLKKEFEANTMKKIIMWNTIEEAWKNCFQEKKDNNLYIVGSLYLVGSIKAMREDKND